MQNGPLQVRSRQWCHGIERVIVVVEQDRWIYGCSWPNRKETLICQLMKTEFRISDQVA